MKMAIFQHSAKAKLHSIGYDVTYDVNCIAVAASIQYITDLYHMVTR